MDITLDHVKEEKETEPLPDVQSTEQDFFNVAAGQESAVQSFTQVFIEGETVEEQRSEIELSTQVFIKKESAVVKGDICEGQESNNTSEDASFR
jgi:hypothetical protein